MDNLKPSSYYDFNSLADLKAQVKSNPNVANKDAAQQIESIFLGLMLKEMRKTVSRSDLLGSDVTETYEQMFDQQISLSMAKAGGIGLAPFLERQMAALKTSEVPAVGLPVEKVPTAFPMPVSTLHAIKERFSVPKD